MTKKNISTLICVAILCLITAFVCATEKPEGVIYFVEEATQGKSFLCSINVDGSKKERLTPAFNSISSPKVHSKSGWIGFTNKTANFESEIYLMVRKKLTRVLVDASLQDFSPDGRSFLFITDDGKGELGIYNISRKRFTHIARGLVAVAAAWSPDSEWIIISALSDYGTTDLYLYSVLSQQTRRLTDTRRINEFFPIFCNDSKTILYLTDEPGSYMMEYMALEINETYRPKLEGIFPSLSPDNEWIAYEHDSQIKIATKTGMNPAVLSEGRTPFWVKK